MFFPERIKNIKVTDKVLEIGPGSTPYERSDVLLEKKYENEEESAAQFGHNQKLVTQKKIFFYDGERFPFKDKEFDFSFAFGDLGRSHVLEHVENVELFLSEIFRVAGKGYLEYPLIYYEYLYNFKVHLNILNFNGEVLRYMKKTSTSLNDFEPVQSFFYESLNKGHVSIINDLLPLMMEGFEWLSPFKTIEAKGIKELVKENYFMPGPPVKTIDVPVFSTKYLLKELLKKVIPA